MTDEPSWAAELRASDAGVRSAAAHRLGDLGDEAAPAIPALISVLTDDCARVQLGAARALARLGGAAVPALEHALRDDDRDRRVSAADSLALMGAAAVPALIRALGDEQARVRELACACFVFIASQAADALPALLPRLTDADVAVRRMAVMAVGWVGAGAAAAALLDVVRKDPSMREAVADALAGNTSAVALETLLDGMRDEEPAVRCCAARGLGCLAAGRAALLTQAGDSASEVRTAVAMALHDDAERDPEVFGLLAELTRDEISDVRVAAASSLARSGFPATASVLARLLEDPEEPVRLAAAKSLDRDGSMPQISALADPDKRGSTPEPGEPGAASVAALIRATCDGRSEVRTAAARALGQLGGDPRSVVPVLIELLKSDYTGGGSVRQAAVESLGALGESAAAATPLMVELLSDPSSDLAGAAARSLGAIGCGGDWIHELAAGMLAGDMAMVGCSIMAQLGTSATPSLPTLFELLERSELGDVRWAAVGAVRAILPDREVRTRALLDHMGKDGLPSTADMRALGWLAGPSPRVLQVLKEALVHGGREVRASAAAAVAGIVPEPEHAVPLLLQAIVDESDDVRRAAAAAFVAYGAPAIKQLITTLGADLWEDRCGAAEALGLVSAGSTAAAQALSACVADENSFVRVEAVRALGKLETPANSRLPALTNALGDEDDMVAVAAAWSVSDLGAAALPGLGALVERMECENEGLRYAAVFALKAIGPEAVAAVPALAARLADRSSRVRRAAAWALEGLVLGDDEPVVAALIAALQDPVGDVRIWAIWTLAGAAREADLPGVVTALETAMADPDEEVRETARLAVHGLLPGAAG